MPKPTPHTDETYSNAAELFAAHDAETPTRYAREAYERTECGVWTGFILQDRSFLVSDRLTREQNTLAWARENIVGIQHGTIVEGSDAEYTADELIFPFTDEALAKSWDFLEEHADAAWHEANGDESEATPATVEG